MIFVCVVTNLLVCGSCSIVEFLVLGRQQLRRLVQDKIIEHIASTVHSLLHIVSSAKQRLLRSHVPSLDQKLLKLKHIKNDILVLLQELVLVLCGLQLEELLAETFDRCLLIDLQFLNFFSSLNNSIHSIFQLFNILASFVDKVLLLLSIFKHH